MNQPTYAIEFGSLTTQIFEVNASGVHIRNVLPHPYLLLSDHNRINIDTLERKVLKPLKRYMQSQTLRPTLKRAIATGIFRNAPNQAEVVTLLEQYIQHEVTLLTSKQECEWSFRSYCENTLASTTTAPHVYIDLGGGSLEVGIFESGSLVSYVSVPLGVLHLMHGIFTQLLVTKTDTPDYLTGIDQHLIEYHIQPALEPHMHFLQELTSRKEHRLVVTGGAVKPLVQDIQGQESVSLGQLFTHLQGLSREIVACDTTELVKAVYVRNRMFQKKLKQFLGGIYFIYILSLIEREAFYVNVFGLKQQFKNLYTISG